MVISIAVNLPTYFTNIKQTVAKIMSLNILCMSEFCARYRVPADVRSLLIPDNGVHVVDERLFTLMKESKKRIAEKQLERPLKKSCKEVWKVPDTSTDSHLSFFHPQFQANSLSVDIESHEILESEQGGSIILCESSDIYGTFNTNHTEDVVDEILQSIEPSFGEILQSWTDDQQCSSPPHP